MTALNTTGSPVWAIRRFADAGVVPLSTTTCFYCDRQVAESVVSWPANCREERCRLSATGRERQEMSRGPDDGRSLNNISRVTAATWIGCVRQAGPASNRTAAGAPAGRSSPLSSGLRTTADKGWG